jgi:hypothetical protein
MRKLLSHLQVLILILILVTVTVSCASSKFTSGANPATDRMGALAGIPAESEVPSGGIIPNVLPMIDAGILAGANTEAVNIKTASRLYLIDHPATSHLTSNELWPSYINAAPKAKYYLVPLTSLITRVDSVSGGWSNIVYSMAQQKWVAGTPDNDHENDQDIP